MLWQQQFQEYSLYIVFTLIILMAISILLHLMMWNKLRKMQNKYQRLTRGIDNKNLEELLFAINEQTNTTSKQLDDIHSEQQKVIKKLKTCVTTPTLLRYNAFDNMGSQLSFSLALIDEKNNGVVLSNIQGRHESRFYAKTVISGKCEQHLSPEEQEVISTSQSPGL